MIRVLQESADEEAAKMIANAESAAQSTQGTFATEVSSGGTVRHGMSYGVTFKFCGNTKLFSFSEIKYQCAQATGCSGEQWYVCIQWILIRI